MCLLCAVFNLTNNIDVENTKQRMEQYQRENRDVIQRNKAKLVCTVCVYRHMHNVTNNNDNNNNFTCKSLEGNFFACSPLQ